MGKICAIITLLVLSVAYGKHGPSDNPDPHGGSQFHQAMSNFKGEDKGNYHRTTHEVPKIYDPEVETPKYNRQRKEYNPNNKAKPFNDKTEHNSGDSKHKYEPSIAHHLDPELNADPQDRIKRRQDSYNHLLEKVTQPKHDNSNSDALEQLLDKVSIADLQAIQMAQKHQQVSQTNHKEELEKKKAKLFTPATEPPKPTSQPTPSNEANLPHLDEINETDRVEVVDHQEEPEKEKEEQTFKLKPKKPKSEEEEQTEPSQSSTQFRSEDATTAHLLSPASLWMKNGNANIALYAALAIAVILLVLMYQFWYYNLLYNLRSLFNSTLFGVFITMYLVVLLGNQDILDTIQQHNKEFHLIAKALLSVALGIATLLDFVCLGKGGWINVFQLVLRLAVTSHFLGALWDLHRPAQLLSFFYGLYVFQFGILSFLSFIQLCTPPHLAKEHVRKPSSSRRRSKRHSRYASDSGSSSSDDSSEEDEPRRKRKGSTSHRKATKAGKGVNENNEDVQEK